MKKTNTQNSTQHAAESISDIAVLIVDDNPAKMLALKAMLEPMNLTIVAVESGQEALHQLLLRDFSVVLLDVNMPIMDGFETAQMIRQRPRSEHLPIIFITAERLEDEARLDGYKLGAVDYIISPVSPVMLRAKIAVFADLYQLRAMEQQHSQEILKKNALIAEQYAQLSEINKALLTLNETLEQRVADEVARSREKDLIMIQQSRLAAMGEMIGNIAHQWRQPLNALGLVLGNIQDAGEYKELTPAYLAEKVQEGEQLIQKMSTTIDDFRDFFRPNKEVQTFCLNKTILESIELVKSSFTSHGIEIQVKHEDEDIWTLGSVNEYSQIVLNLLNNAKDSILAKFENGGCVCIILKKEGNNACIKVIDNGEGIAEEAMPHLFDPYYSTKKNGTGIGLYMSKMIIDKMNGKLSAQNQESGGAEFTLLTPLSLLNDG